LVLAALLVDGIWPAFLLLDWEKVEIVPGIIAVTPLLFVSYSYTHSLVAGVLWAALLAAATMHCAAIVPARCGSPHWSSRIGYSTSRRTGRTCRCGRVGRRSGSGPWYSLPATLAVELALFALGAWIHASDTRSRDRIGGYAMWFLIVALAALCAASVFGPPPPSVQVLAWSGLLGWLVIAGAYWIDRHREPATT
jgi:hypothetical protein